MHIIRRKPSSSSHLISAQSRSLPLLDLSPSMSLSISLSLSSRALFLTWPMSLFSATRYYVRESTTNASSMYISRPCIDLNSDDLHVVFGLGDRHAQIGAQPSHYSTLFSSISSQVATRHCINCVYRLQGIWVYFERFSVYTTGCVIHT